MSNFNEQLESEFHKTLCDFVQPISDSVNKNLVEYFKELGTSESNKEEVFLKTIQKSNKLILKETIQLIGLFARFTQDDKKTIIEKLKQSNSLTD